MAKAALLDEGPYRRCQRYELQAEVGGEWQPLAAGTTIGHREQLTFEPTPAGPPVGWPSVRAGRDSASPNSEIGKGKMNKAEAHTSNKAAWIENGTTAGRRQKWGRGSPIPSEILRDPFEAPSKLLRKFFVASRWQCRGTKSAGGPIPPKRRGSSFSVSFSVPRPLPPNGGYARAVFSALLTVEIATLCVKSLLHITAFTALEFASGAGSVVPEVRRAPTTATSPETIR